MSVLRDAAGLVTAFLAGAGGYAATFVDPGLLWANVDAWFGITALLVRFIGPELAEGVPWDLVFLGVVSVVVIVKIAKYRRSES